MRRRAERDESGDRPAVVLRPTLASASRKSRASRERRTKRRNAVLWRVVALVSQGILVGMVAAVVAVLLAPRLSAYATPQSYVYGDSTTAVLLQWSEYDSHIDGTLQIATADEQAQVIRAQYSAFNGLHDGPHLTVNFTNALGAVQTIEGTLGWRSLQLELPQSDGQLAGISLVAGELADYTHAVQAIQRAHPGFEIQGN